MKYHFDMEDKIINYLLSEIHLQDYARKMINKPIEEKTVINRLSIASVKQRLKK